MWFCRMCANLIIPLSGGYGNAEELRLTLGLWVWVSVRVMGQGYILN